jgi:hypothetical protein
VRREADCAEDFRQAGDGSTVLVRAAWLLL